MTFGSIDYKNLDEDLGRRSPDEKKLENRKRLNSENLSPEDVIVGGHINVDSLDPQDLLVLVEEGKIPKSAVYDFQKPKAKKLGSNLGLEDFELEPESDDELTINSSSEPSDVAEKEVEEIISKSKEEALSKERAALISKKRDDEFSDIESHGKRGKEHKGKFKKGLESIKRLLKIK